MTKLVGTILGNICDESRGSKANWVYRCACAQTVWCINALTLPCRILTSTGIPQNSVYDSLSTAHQVVVGVCQSGNTY